LAPSLLSFFSAHYLYPVRIRVVNDVTGVVEWHTIAYVPYVHNRKEPGAKEKAKGRHWGVLQRTLYLAFRDAIQSSHRGTLLDESIGGLSLAFFRILLYACDRPEERSVLCLKAGSCGRPCSTCDVLAEDVCTVNGTEGVPRAVIDSLEDQTEATALSRANKKRPRRLYLESKRNMNAFIPALVCLGGLTTAPHYLYKMIAFDPLHVRFPSPLCFFLVVWVPLRAPLPRLTEGSTLCALLAPCVWLPFSLRVPLAPPQILDLGITRMLCHRLVFLFPRVCSEFYPLYRDESATLRAGNMRIDLLGRRSLASFVPPGYVLARVLLSVSVTVRLPFSSSPLLFSISTGTDAVTDWATGFPFLFSVRESAVGCCHQDRRYLVAPDEKQATFTGEQQRGAVWFMMFIVMGLFSPGSTRRPPPKKKAKGNVATTSTPKAKTQPLRQPSTAAAAPSSAQPTASTAATNLADGVVEAATSNEDPDAELEDVLASLMAEIDMAEGDAEEAWRDNSDAGSAASQASGASAASDSSGDSDTSATRAAAAAPAVGGKGKTAKGKRTKKVLSFDKVAYMATFGDTPYHVAVTTLLVKYAQLLSRLTGHHHCRAPMTVAEAEEVGAMAKSFVLEYMVPILGEWFSTKVHKLLAHVIEAIKQHGAPTNGDTGSNEALHGQDKRRYSRASGSDDAFRTQMLRVRQGSKEIRARLAKEAAEFDGWFGGDGDAGDEGDAALACGGAAPGDGRRPPVSAVRRGVCAGEKRTAIPRRAVAVALDQLAERRGLGAVADALGLPSGGTLVHLTNSLTFTPRIPCCAESVASPHPMQHLRATPMYRGVETQWG